MVFVFEKESNIKPIIDLVGLSWYLIVTRQGHDDCQEN